MMSLQVIGSVGFIVRFQSLFNEGKALSFPCDRQGRVDLDSLSPRAKGNYFFARAMVGREFALPAVEPGELH
jgi:hypothetical protein